VSINDLVGRMTPLVARSIGENIAYGVGGATDREIVSAAELASAHEFIDRLPDGYDAPIGDRGVQLSGGQRQRLAIARAVLRRPRILILDEATSALDQELESIVQLTLRTLDYRPTTLIIAHRLSTVATVDRVVVLDEGRIIESGTHERLLNTSAFYRQLVQTACAAAGFTPAIAHEASEWETGAALVGEGLAVAMGGFLAPSRISLAPATRLTTVNGAIGMRRIAAIASTPPLMMRRCTRFNRGPTTARKVSRPIAVPTA